MVTAIGLVFLAVVWAEIVLLAVWEAAISISGKTRLPMISWTTPLNSWTSQIWV